MLALDGLKKIRLLLYDYYCFLVSLLIFKQIRLLRLTESPKSRPRFEHTCPVPSLPSASHHVALDLQTSDIRHR